MHPIYNAMINLYILIALLAIAITLVILINQKKQRQ